MSIKNTINSLDFFSTLTDEQVTLLISISSVQNYSKDYVLHYEKKHTSDLLFLNTGLAKAYKIDKYKNEVFLYYTYGNSLLSEISDVFSDSLHFFSNIELVEDSQILSVNYLEFKKHFLGKNILSFEFINEIILKSKKLQFLVNREFVFDSVAKVAIMLHSDLGMFNKLKRHDIALILHIQPATLSRVLNRLKRNKIIEIMQGKITILDSKALKLIFEEQ